MSSLVSGRSKGFEGSHLLMSERFEEPEAGAGVVEVDIVLVLMRYTCKISFRCGDAGDFVGWYIITEKWKCRVKSRDLHPLR